jgi:hypothetical protein
MSPDRFKLALLTVLLAVLGVLVYRGVWREPPPVQDGASGQPGASVARSTSAIESGLQVNQLEAAGAPEPVIRRDLFRFGERSAAPEVPSVSSPRLGTPSPDEQVAAPAGERVAFTLIGIVETPNESARVAVLSDGRGVYHGAAGDIIEGQFRIVSVGPESVEMSRLGDQARQVIRLQGAAAGSSPAVQ